MGRVSWPFLGLHIDGCIQGLHNDARSGRFGFVCSLTRDDRKTVGNDALVMRETDHFRNNLRTAAAALSFHNLIEARFNRLLIFDTAAALRPKRSSRHLPTRRKLRLRRDRLTL
jgi:hypothetical protein